MEKISVMRRIRTECGVSLKEMEKLTGVSHQYLSEIELSEGRKSAGAETLARKAFEAVIAERTAGAIYLSRLYDENRAHILDFAPLCGEETDGQ
jgi:transcriptional regulator with XRE-family HTH domain